MQAVLFVLVVLFIVFCCFWKNDEPPKIHPLKEALLRAEIIYKLKQGNYTEAELDYIIGDNKELRKLLENDN